MSFKPTRRTFLKQLLAAGASAPLLSLPGLGRLAVAAGQPKLKVLFVVIPDGFGVDPYLDYSNGLWYPSTAETDTTQFDLNVMSGVLAPYKSQALFLRGFILAGGQGGHAAWNKVLRDSLGSQTSIDNLIAEQLPGSDPTLKRLYSGPHAMVGVTWNISYSGNQMILPEDDPYKLFERVFGSVATSTKSLRSSRSLASSSAHLFDPVNAEIQQLRNQLAGSERAKLDTHLDAIEQLVSDLRQQAAAPAPIIPSSLDPAALQPVAGMNIHSADFREEVTEAHSGIVAGALGSGVTRVATLQIGRSADQVVIKSVSPNRNPHDCAHRSGTVEEWKGSRLWYMQRVKSLLDKLSAMTDPDMSEDSLLDHTLVVLTSEMADGAPEHMLDLPVTMIGGASGLLMNGNGSGRYYSVKGFGERQHWQLGQITDLQRVWATLAQAVGTTVPYGGDITPLPGIFSNVS